jgi:hypothetical protein
MSWKKEKKEHPWASTATAKRIASDHAKGKVTRRKVTSTPYGWCIERKIEYTAKEDFSNLHNGYKGVASRRVI